MLFPEVGSFRRSVPASIWLNIAAPTALTHLSSPPSVWAAKVAPPVLDLWAIAALHCQAQQRAGPVVPGGSPDKDPAVLQYTTWKWKCYQSGLSTDNRSCGTPGCQCASPKITTPEIKSNCNFPTFLKLRPFGLMVMGTEASVCQGHGTSKALHLLYNTRLIFKGFKGT